MLENKIPYISKNTDHRIQKIIEKFKSINYRDMYDDEKGKYGDLIEKNGKILANFRLELYLEMRYMLICLFIASQSDYEDLNDRLLNLLCESDFLKLRKNFHNTINNMKTENSKPTTKNYEILNKIEALNQLDHFINGPF